MRVGVVTDSTCDLPTATLRRVQVEAVPLQIRVGDETYLDWRELEPATLYDWMRHQGVIPSVRAPDPEDFMQVYRQGLERFDSLISIHLSPHFSRTLRNARLAAERLGVEKSVTFVDSGSAGAGLAEIVLEAARLARDGASNHSVERVALQISAELYGIFSPSVGSWVGKSDWLRGVRERRHRAMGHRPLVAMEGGRLLPLGWTNESRAPDALATALRKRFGDLALRVAVAYGGTEQEELTRLRLALERGGLEIAHGRIQLIGAAVGARLGPGARAVFARPVPVARTFSVPFPTGRQDTSPE